MNFLAHIYLSGDNDMVMIGNFMADGIHGNDYEDFPPDVKKGILLHRAIDSFTDAHPVFRQSTKRLHPVYHHFSGVIVDIFYDHFLAKNWNDYHNEPLEEYAQKFYSLLKSNYNILTTRAKTMMPHMLEENWLASYATLEGIGHILKQMDRRTKYRSGMGKSIIELKEFYKDFEEEFRTFFSDIKGFVKEKTTEL